MIDYVQALKQPWLHLGQDFVFQNNCLQSPPEGNGIWNLALPSPQWNHNTVVLMHCQDFINFDHTGVRELIMMEAHFQDRSRQVVIVTWEIDLQERYQGPIHLAYFPTHTYNIIVNLRQITERWKPKLENIRSRRYQCLNGVPRPHRIKAVGELDLIMESDYVSLAQARELPIWPYHPTYFNCENEHNYLRLLPVYGDADINVVTETIYEERPGIITEKTLFALMSLQVPIFIGYAGMIDHIRSLGFDVFEDIVDISYDWLPNDIRVEEAIRRNRDLLLSGFNRESLLPRLQRNQDLVLQWPEKMIKDYQARCLEIQGVLATA
jgi:hypothetical protein